MCDNNTLIIVVVIIIIIIIIAKYYELTSKHIFYPVAIETGGTWNHWAVELVQ